MSSAPAHSRLVALDPDVQAMLHDFMAGGAFTGEFDPVAFRPVMEAISPALWDPNSIQGVRTTSLTVQGAAGELSAELYAPDGASESLSLLVFFHGGGFTAGSINTSRALGRFLALEADCLVLSADYRLAPEHPFPSGVEDASAVLRWAFANAARLGADPMRIAVGGDAPGATYAAVAALMARDDALPLTYQFLLAPATDFASASERKTALLKIGPVSPSAIEAAERCLLRTSADRMDWRCSPLHASSHRGLAPAFVMVGEYDFVAPEVEAYVVALERAEVPVAFHSWPGATHNFFSMYERLPIARVALKAAAFQLRQGLSRPRAAPS